MDMIKQALDILLDAFSYIKYGEYGSVGADYLAEQFFAWVDRVRKVG